MEIKAMRYILSIALLNCLSQQMAMAEDFMLFRDTGSSDGKYINKRVELVGGEGKDSKRGCVM
jgi:hypothetical protein